VTDFSAEELVHERKMSDDGAERYRLNTERLRAKDSNAATIPGRALVREYLGPIEEGIREFLKAAKKGPGVHHNAAPMMRLVKPPALALVTLVTVVDQMFGTRPALQWGRAIGAAVEDEWRCLEVRRADPSFFRDLEKRVDHLGPQRRRLWVLRRSKTRGVLPARWSLKERSALGLALLSIVEQRTRLLQVRTARSGKKTTTLVGPTEEALEWVKDADDAAAAASALYRPTLDMPVPWVGPEGGGYRTDLVLRRDIARFRGRTHQAAVRGADPASYAVVTSGLNRLQDSPWRVNRDVLETVAHLNETGGAPLEELVRLPLPERPDQGDDEEDWDEWRKTARECHRLNDQRDGRRLLVYHTLAAARAMVDAPRFYFPHRLCFRGRSYPTPNWLQPQGPDVARGLLRFADAEPMTPEGWDALMAWGDELGTDSADVEAVRAVHSDPLEHSAAWATTKKPFQALAWFLEVGEALEVGYPHRPFLTSLPCFVDASNNGLQLYALLTGCRDLARLTNVLPGPRQDLYQVVADSAWERVEADAKDGHTLALEWVRILDRIPREGAKRPVMTRGYNVTAWSAADYVRQWYFETFCSPADRWGPLPSNQKGTRYLARRLMEAVDRECPAAVAAMRWLSGLAASCAEKGVPFRWTAPSGWHVVQEYRKRKDRRVKTVLGGSVRKIQLWQETGRADFRRQTRAAPPNYVHSVDASIMAEAVTAFEGPVAAVHDAFGTVAPRVPALLADLREAVAKVCVDSRPFDVTSEEVRRYIGENTPDPPWFGGIAREEVLASEHMFG
jgi:DNA-directed RNA polymerase